MVTKSELQEVRVFAPATVANVACGYDVLGFAIDKPGDEILVRKSDKPGLRITKIEGDGGKLPMTVEGNTAGVAALDLLKHLGMTDEGIEMEIYKKMPFGSGLGSSAASAVAGVYAVNKLIGEPLTKKQLLPFAMTGEASADGAYHADNVGPSLLGGIVFIRSNEELDIAQLPVPKDLWAAVVHPNIEILTKVARDIMPTEIPLCDYEAKRTALSNGALGFSISGAGPSVFALCEGPEIAKKVGAAVSQTFSNIGLENQTHISPINREGVHVIEEK